MPWTLPPELDDMIIDHLHDDLVSLARCALVHRSWLPVARYHYWNHLRINCASNELARLRQLLTSSHDVRFHIRNVVVAQKKGGVSQWYDLNLLHLTLSVLSLLPNLTTLTLDGLWFGGPRGGEKAAAAVIAPSIRRLTISTCSFDTFEDVQHLCRAFPTLTHLHLDGVWWGRWMDSNLPQGTVIKPTAPVLALRELDLGSCFSRDQVVEWLLSSAPSNSIETLRLPLIGAYDTRLRDLLVSVSESLRHLEIGSPSTSHGRARRMCSALHFQIAANAAERTIAEPNTDPERPLEAYLDLTSNTCLRSITLGVPTYRDSEFITTWLRNILSQATSPVLDEIRFAVYPILRGDVAEAETMLASFGWSEMAKMLERPQFASVRKITFSSGRSTDYMQIPGAFVNLTPLLQKVIPKYFDVELLGKRGIELSFQCI